MIAALVIVFRLCAAALLLPLAISAMIAGQWIGAGVSLAVLALVCGRSERD